MAERKWLRLDKHILDRPELSEVLAEESGFNSILIYCKLLLNIGELVPCDKQVLGRKIGIEPAVVQMALNKFYKLGLIAVTEKSPADPPSLEEIEEYCKELHSNVDPQRFYDYYAADRFTYRGEPIDWKAKLRQWNVKEATRGKTCSGRSYGRVDLDELKKMQGTI